jgi:hypothetical protein
MGVRIATHHLTIKGQKRQSSLTYRVQEGRAQTTHPAYRPAGFSGPQIGSGARPARTMHRAWRPRRVHQGPGHCQRRVFLALPECPADRSRRVQVLMFMDRPRVRPCSARRRFLRRFGQLLLRLQHHPASVAEPRYSLSSLPRPQRLLGFSGSIVDRCSRGRAAAGNARGEEDMRRSCGNEFVGRYGRHTRARMSKRRSPGA